jgi:prepilin-type N-terminal cleavage/methylation domain-containing protein
MRAPRGAPRSDAGVTLIEVLVTISIMGIAFTALLGALIGIFQTGDTHRKVAVSETLVRRYADAVDTAPYVDCAEPTDYAAAVSEEPPPTGFTVQVTAVEYWDGNPNSAFLGTSPDACIDKGVQRVNVRVTQTDPGHGFVDNFLVVKRNPA